MLEDKKHEWHPFTITSCPEELDKVTVHISVQVPIKTAYEN